MTVSYTVTVSDEEDKAFKHGVEDPQGWIDHAVSNQCRKCVDRVVTAESEYNYKKIDTAAKLTIVRDADIKTRAEINAEEEAARIAEANAKD